MTTQKLTPEERARQEALFAEYDREFAEETRRIHAEQAARAAAATRLEPFVMPADVEAALLGDPGAARPVDVLPLPVSPSPAAAGATHRFGLPVPEAVFHSYAYLADTLDVAEAPIQIMRYEGFRDWAKRTFGHGGKPAEVVRETARLASVATAKRRALVGKQHVWDYYAFRQVHRDAGLPVGPQNPPATKLAPADKAAMIRANAHKPVDPRDLGPNEDMRWWGQWPDESARAWCKRVAAQPLPMTAAVAVTGMKRGDPETTLRAREAAALRQSAADAQRRAARAARAEEKAAGPDPLTAVAGAPVRTLSRAEDVARRLALPWAERVREDVACIMALGRPLPAMPCTTARIAAERV